MQIGSSNFETTSLSNYVHFKNEGFLRHCKVVLFRCKEWIFGCGVWIDTPKIIEILEKTFGSLSQKDVGPALRLFNNVDLTQPLQEKIQSISQCVFLPQFDKSKKTTNNYLQVDPEWEIHYEESGNPNGIPVVFVHGGPGWQSADTDHCWFDPQKYRIITFDQRGSGKSRPTAWDRNIHASTFSSLTTTQLAEDMEKLRKHLKIEDKWLVFGGSWGSTLSLFYGQKYPEHTAGLIVRGIFLGTPDEFLNFYTPQFLSNMLGDKWDPTSLKILCDYAKVDYDPKKFYGGAYYDPRRLIDALYTLIIKENDFRAMYLVATYEDYIDSPSPEMLEKLKNIPSKEEEVEPGARSLGILETHFFTTMYKDVNLMNPAGIKALQNIPTVIVQGENDTVCPKENAQTLAKILPQAEFQLIKNGKHSSYGKEMTDALVRATDKWADKQGKF